MKVFVAGATGAVGKMLIPLLVSRVHRVVGIASWRDGFRAEFGTNSVSQTAGR
jgi:nucleoside-diphosphate-sugar epimerase